MSLSPELSIVVPVYNESQVLPELHRRLTQVLHTLDASYEIVYVDDGSRDDSFARLFALAQGNPCVRVIKLSRNFGYQIALTAGLRFARGQAIITMDADLQMPPEYIPKFVDAWRNGAKIVNGVRVDSSDTTPAKKLTSRLFYRLISRLSSTPIQPNAPDFRLIDRCVLNVLNTMDEQPRFLRGLIGWLGFQPVNIEFQAADRYAGRPKFSWSRMFSFSMDAIVSFSVIPLRLSILLGFLVATIGLVYGIYVVVIGMFSKEAVPGWASTTLVTLVIGSSILMVLGIIGEYVGRIHNQVKNRPLFVVEQMVGAPMAESVPAIVPIPGGATKTDGLQPVER